jgi:glycosyltransferase involved in cell wall biosynthesis
MIIFVSDMDLRGSGYMNIATSLCKDLTRRGYDLKALGFGYTGQEHPYDFSIIPVPHQGAVRYASVALQNMFKLGVKIDAIIVALDIPLQIHMVKIEERKNIPYIGIFPVESPPLSRTWAMELSQIDYPLVISNFGTKVANEADLEARYIEIGIDLESWRRPTSEERAKIRGSMGIGEDEKLVLTVADNHERKNLSAAVRALSRLKDDFFVHWALVSRIDFRGGWNFSDLTEEYGIADRFMSFERGLSFSKLWALYAAADAFLLTSKSEGLCMPILEAMACGVPVVATNCTAITEHLIDGRGRLCNIEYEHQDVWGNAWRFYVDHKHAAINLRYLFDKPDEAKKIADAAYEYVSSRTLEKAGDLLEDILENEITRREEDVEQEIREAARVASL